MGRWSGIVPKTFLPNYGEYYERRWFSSSEELPEDFGMTASELGIPAGPDDRIAVGRNLLFSIPEGPTFGVELCEDLWTPLPPARSFS